MIDYDYSTPAAYAGRIARYVADPSTIRARTLDQYGKAPSLDECRRLRAKHIQVKPVSLWRCGHDRTDENTVWTDLDHDECLICHNARKATLTAMQKERQAKREAERAKSNALRQRALERQEASRIASAMALFEGTRFEGIYFIDELIAAVAHAFAITPEELKGKSRFSREICARFVVIKILRERGNLSLPQIGRRLNRDHSTVVNALKKFKKQARKFPEMQRVYEALR